MIRFILSKLLEPIIIGCVHVRLDDPSCYLGWCNNQVAKLVIIPSFVSNARPMILVVDKCSLHANSSLSPPMY